MVAVSDVALDDIVIVKAGGKVPVDGAIISGEAQLNEAMMTSESVPREKTTGEAVFSGTIVDEGYIKVQAKKVGEDTAFNQIIELVEEAQDQKSQTEKFLDRFSQYYTPGVVILSVIVDYAKKIYTLMDQHLDVTFVKGQGLSGSFDGQQYVIGNRRLMDAQGIALTNDINRQIETADVVVMNDRLDKLVHAYRLAKATVKNRTQNIAIALLTVFFLLLGVLNGTIHLASGMFVHEASVLIVILNGMRLIRFQPKE